MKTIKWCLETKRGIELIEPNENLAQAYVLKAEDSLRAAAALTGNKDWEISASYYTMYFSLYAILMKIGVKSEIHSCTINFMKEFLKDYYTSDEIQTIEETQQARIDTQYYSDRNISEARYQKIITQTPRFHAQSKHILHKITEKRITHIRDHMQELIR